MKLFFFVILFAMTFCPVWPSAGKLPDVPSVLFLGVDFPEESATYIENQIASGLKILDLTDSPEVTYRCVRGIKEAAEIISTEKTGRYRVFVIQCRDLNTNENTFCKIRLMAARQNTDILWMTSDTAQIVSCNCDFAVMRAFVPIRKVMTGSGVYHISQMPCLNGGPVWQKEIEVLKGCLYGGQNSRL